MMQELYFMGRSINNKTANKIAYKLLKKLNPRYNWRTRIIVLNYKSFQAIGKCALSSQCSQFVKLTIRGDNIRMLRVFVWKFKSLSRDPSARDQFGSKKYSCEATEWQRLARTYKYYIIVWVKINAVGDVIKFKWDVM